MENHHNQTQLDPVEARQGFKDRNVRNVLVVSLSLAILAGFGYFLIISLGS